MVYDDLNGKSVDIKTEKVAMKYINSFVNGIMKIKQ